MQTIQQPGGQYEPLDPRWQEVRKKDKRDPSWQWKTPISFWGKVVDESNSPVAAATIRFSWSVVARGRFWNGTDTVEVVSTTNGLFSLKDQAGKGLSVAVGKDGYYTSRSNQTRFEYAAFWEKDYHVPKQNEPVTFHLRKKGQIERLIAHSALLKIAPDDTPVGFDPIRSKLDKDGPFMFSLSTGRTDQWEHIEMRLKTSIAGGGIQKSEGEFPFVAPTNGYTSSTEATLGLADSRGPFESRRVYFFYLGDPPVYGRVQVQIPGHISRGTANLPLVYWINPSGSRNLEFDPYNFSHVIKVPEYYLEPNTPLIDSFH